MNNQSIILKKFRDCTGYYDPIVLVFDVIYFLNASDFCRMEQLINNTVHGELDLEKSIIEIKSVTEIFKLQKMLIVCNHTHIRIRIVFNGRQRPHVFELFYIAGISGYNNLVKYVIDKTKSDKRWNICITDNSSSQCVDIIYGGI